MQSLKRIRLGELLIQHHLLTKEQLASAIAKQNNHAGKLGDILIEMGYLDEELLLQFLAKQLQIPLVDLKTYPLNPDLIQQLPATDARRYRAILLTDNPTLLVGMADPQDIYAFDELSRVLNRPFDIALVQELELLKTLDSIYRRTQEITQFAEKLTKEVDERNLPLSQQSTTLNDVEVPVAQLLQSLFEDALQVNASDIHIEPDEHVLRIRQRIDGVLQEQVMRNLQIASALAIRLKLMANLNIAERRLPQDGRFTIKVKEKSIDVRISTMPVQFGESIVMRLLDHTSTLLTLDKTGMPPDILSNVRQLMQLPYGMLLITGPTGSGKTTTLYGMLSELNSVDTKIISVEDPVEYRLPRINQVQVNPQLHLGFVEVLRAALRQDPDIIMVGEIRDTETANIALRAAMTGHLVLSTMHTNDTISAVLRFLEMKSEAYLVAASLRAVLAQRLLRRICDACTQPYTLTAAEAAWLKGIAPQSIPDNVQWKVGKGCPHCHQTGFRGRIGVYELLMLNAGMIESLRIGNLAGFTQAAQQQKARPLWQSALELAVQGISSLQEVMRILSGLEEYPAS